jgi:hypothetical protein
MDRLELLRSAYNHVSRTSSWPWEMFAPDAKFDLSAATGPVTDDQREVREAWREYAECFESFKIDPEEFFEAGPDRIVAVVRDSGRPKGSRQDIHSEYTHVWTFGVDDKITGWASFPTRAQAFAHAGLKKNG